MRETIRRRGFLGGLLAMIVAPMAAVKGAMQPKPTAASAVLGSIDLCRGELIDCVCYVIPPTERWKQHWPAVGRLVFWNAANDRPDATDDSGRNRLLGVSAGPGAYRPFGTLHRGLSEFTNGSLGESWQPSDAAGE